MVFEQKKCNLRVAKKREQERKNRFIGLAEGTKEVIKNIPNYDLEIDTNSLSPKECAQIILKFIKKNYSPTSTACWKSKQKY